MNYRRRWSRLLQMGAEEITTRLRQTGRRQLDLALFRCGIDPLAVGPVQEPHASSSFFFQADEVASRLALLRKHLPTEVEAIIAEADRICRHKFDLLGYKGVDYGPTIDWHLDAVNGRRAPLKPWFRIAFLDFQEVGDHKVIWELNRHQHLVTLAKAYRFTSDRRYTDELVSELQHWQQTNPYPWGINWASALEVAFRGLSWIWIKNLLAGCPALPQRFDRELVGGLRQCGRYLERFHSKYFSPNTHLLGEALALLFIGINCPEIPEARAWRQWGWETLLHEAEVQVRPDGVYFEQSLYYHVYALDMFLYARALAARNGFVIPERFDATIQKMLRFLLAVFECGPGEGFGDDDGGRLFNARRNCLQHMTDPLALGAVEYQERDWGTRAGITEEAIWFFGEAAIPVCSGEFCRNGKHSQAFESGGVYLLRDTEFTQQMMIDAGPLGGGSCGHGHADALSVGLTVNGHRCLVDAGSCCYVSAGEERNIFRGTAAHNTMRVDGQDQAEPQGPFNWSSIPETRTRQWITGETFALFDGEHDGYSRLPDPVLHRRMVFHRKGAFWLIRDIAQGREEHSLETFWHFGPKYRLQPNTAGITAFLEPPSSASDVAIPDISLRIAEPSIWEVEVGSGKISPAYGASQDAPVVRVRGRLQLPTECAVLLAPMRKKETRFDRDMAETSPGVSAYRYTSGHSSHLICFSDNNEAWRYSHWSSDAKLFYAELKDGQLQQMIVVGGSSASWQDRVVFSHSERIERFEWISSGGSIRTFSSAPVSGYPGREQTLLLDPVS